MREVAEEALMPEQQVQVVQGAVVLEEMVTEMVFRVLITPAVAVAVAALTVDSQVALVVLAL
ncbi:MAG: hypothetical protein EBS69_06780 [Verrucomicrobia bacterium]|nr:hypothetical protein [Verrucomicrobiota bacterium]NBS79717.1 hypothetical protein [bacterium]